ncbi:DUF4178 domain-containing protein [Novosphingobium terrae]|uniref:DUF4178 domain-containing protein n=1 Tax=Novosphingobium terrae TaxID=2726189 RepID=UPI001980E967|nr:DUF4178 domain-containing protein [Novosphingobium terrae]
MSDLLCPQCGAPVPLRSAAMPYAVCGHCQSVILREGDAATRIGEAASLPFDVSPIELGTRGTAPDGAPFTVAGRVRWGWGDGAWNEWLLALPGGGYAWLGEAMGQFQYLTERKDLLDHPLLRDVAAGGSLPLGAVIELDGRIFTATDVKRATCLGSEGDLPFATPIGLAIDSIDFREPLGAALSIQRDPDGVSAYAGAYIDLGALKPKGLRQIEGWTLPEALR